MSALHQERSEHSSRIQPQENKINPNFDKALSGREQQTRTRCGLLDSDRGQLKCHRRCAVALAARTDPVAGCRRKPQHVVSGRSTFFRLYLCRIISEFPALRTSRLQGREEHTEEWDRRRKREKTTLAGSGGNPQIPLNVFILETFLFWQRNTRKYQRGDDCQHCSPALHPLSHQ